MAPTRATLSWADILLTGLAPAIWGTTYIVTTELLPPDRPFTAALLRALPAGLVLILWCRAMPRRGEWLRMLVLAALNIASSKPSCSSRPTGCLAGWRPWSVPCSRCW